MRWSVLKILFADRARIWKICRFGCSSECAKTEVYFHTIFDFVDEDIIDTILFILYNRMNCSLVGFVFLVSEAKPHREFLNESKL